MKNEKILRDFVVDVYEMTEYFALVKIQSIHDGWGVSGFTSEEYKLMQKLIKDEPTRVALEKLLVDCGFSNVFSLCTYIDGATGVKPLELVNADTGEPVAENMTHEYLVSSTWGDQWASMMKKVVKCKKSFIKSFKERPKLHI